MSTSIVTMGELVCDGDGGWPCTSMGGHQAFFQTAHYHSFARDTRKEARAEGWTVNLKGGAHRRRLDLCPECAAKSKLRAVIAEPVETAEGN